MSENTPKRVIDITNVELMHGEPAVCLGNGERGFECCCDECDYYLLCFPEFAPKAKKNMWLKIKPVFHNPIKWAILSVKKN